MVQITEALLRGRAEHNDRSLHNLKEISLHQQNLEGINRALTRLCPEIEILYLQVRWLRRFPSSTDPPTARPCPFPNSSVSFCSSPRPGRRSSKEASSTLDRV